MQANRTMAGGSPAVANALGILAVLLVSAVLANVSLPLIATDRMAFFALAIIGMAMCGPGMGSAQARLGWMHPMTLIGGFLGVLALALVLAVLLGQLAFLSPLATLVSGDFAAVAPERVAFVALAAIMAVKWAIGFGWATR